MGKISVDKPTSFLVGICNPAALDIAPNACMVQFFFHCPEEAFNVSQTLTKSQLGKGHAQKLIKTCKRTDAIIAFVTFNAASKLTFGQKVDDLSKYGFSMIHHGLLSHQ
jgi:hypothetical protein